MARNADRSRERRKKMVAKRSKKAAKRVKDLPAKSLSSKHEKGVKGGFLSSIGKAVTSVISKPFKAGE